MLQCLFVLSEVFLARLLSMSSKVYFSTRKFVCLFQSLCFFYTYHVLIHLTDGLTPAQGNFLNSLVEKRDSGSILKVSETGFFGLGDFVENSRRPFLRGISFAILRLEGEKRSFAGDFWFHSWRGKLFVVTCLKH